MLAAGAALLLTLAVTLIMVDRGRLLFAELDPAEKWGWAGMLGLAFLGLGTLFFGALPNGLRWGLPVGGVLIGILAIWSISRLVPGGGLRFPVSVPRGFELLLAALISLLAVFALIAALAPSTVMDWDSLAYHLAVPKIWLDSGQIHFVSAIHHSNFPFTVDNLFIWGLWFGDQAGAKFFNWAFLPFGAMALFGLIRRITAHSTAAWVAALLFAAAPVVAWESGTAYIDVPHGLFAGLGMVFLLHGLLRVEGSRSFLLLGGLGIGFGAGTKYTGLQVAVATLVILAIVLALNAESRRRLRPLGLAVLVGIAVASPWYIKNLIVVENPVYPFFSSVFGGRDWSPELAAIYSNEQQTFGVGRTESGRDPLAVGHAIFGLAYQPGRYVNPGQEQGLGFPTGAIGFAALLSALLLAISSRHRPEDRALLGALLLLMVMWFFLSQQSRYLTFLIVPCAALGGLAWARTAWRPVVAGAAVVQAFVTLGILWLTQTPDQLRVVLGQESREDFQRTRIGFFEPAQAINAYGPQRVALFDEVFGFLLDVPYMWANPGHSTMLGYEQMTSGDDFVAALREHGFDTVYVNLGIYPPEFRDAWIATILGQPGGWSEAEIAARRDNLETGWQIWITEAIQSGQLEPIPDTTGAFRRGLWLRVAP